MISEIIFAAGCFWGVEKHFAGLDGVLSVESGYAGGSYKNPTYEDVLKYRNSKDIINHTEAVRVKFDTSKLKTKNLIHSFWEIHNPTQLNQQGNDIGNNYRSALYYTNDEQKEIAIKTKEIYQKLLNKKGYGQIVTQIEKLNKFWIAEDYHQNYLDKNPNGYCPNHSTGVKFEKETKEEIINYITPTKGKEIIVIVADGYCPYCDKFKKDVISKYNGTIKLREAKEKELKDFKIKTDLSATPTILFIEDGKEISSYRGYMNEKDFYEALGLFKFGKNSEAFNVAYSKGTDGRFCKQYDKFKNTEDGYFIDSISGEKLFDTKDRFNSGTGWLSFYKAIDNSIIEKKDLSYGMSRVEIIAKKSGIHLGHVFDEGDTRRFCINASVLEFVKK